MTPKQERFVAEYLIDLNATQAAIRAGYSRHTARQAGAENLSKPVIARAIAAGKKRVTERAELSAVNVLEEIRRVAFCDARAFFDERGNLKTIAQLDAEQGAALAGFEVIIKNAEAGDGKTDKIHKIKLWDKVRALEMLAKYFGLLTEKTEHSGEISFRWLEPSERS
jgi:phage terminase small subunit